MATHHATFGELLASAGEGDPAWGDGAVLVDLDSGDLPPGRVAPIRPVAPGVVIGLTSVDRPHEHPAAPLCDLVLRGGAPVVDQVLATLLAAPLATRALVVLMRSAPRPTIDDGLAAESAVYSTLQAGPEFATWRASTPVRVRDDRDEPVLLHREGSELHVTLNRPLVRNALNTAMRDALVEAFMLPALDRSISEVHLRGSGEAFCAGGDLDEFGTFPDPATAHVVRLRQSVGRAIDAVADRVTAHLHGACAGSGIELPAFAGRVVAAADARISLPELSLGLIPGAGGTVSLTRRIGRHRTTRLALSGELLDAGAALEWGIVDELAGTTARG